MLRQLYLKKYLLLFIYFSLTQSYFIKILCFLPIDNKLKTKSAYFNSYKTILNQFKVIERVNNAS